jgi:hypothetical protein
MKKLLHWFILLALTTVFTFGTTALAFQDIEGHAAKESIQALQEAGIVSGVEDQRFEPEGKVTYAQAVQLIVKGLRLNIDHIRFIKQPEASDYFLHVPNDAWYAEAFIIGHLNGIPIPKDVDPEGQISREQFAHLLMQTVLSKGDYAFIKIFIVIADEADIDPNYMGSIQYLLISKIAKLNEGQKFLPKEPLTRGQAAIWIHGAMKFIENHKPVTLPEPQEPVKPQPHDDVTMEIEKVDDGVNKVTLSWGTKPSSGYLIQVRGIEFDDNGEAHITYELIYPQKDMAYLTVITEPKAVTYVSSAYKPVLRGDIGGGAPAAADNAARSADRAAEQAEAS